MKKRIVKVLGFFVLNILFFTILLGFVGQPDKAVRAIPSSINIHQQPEPEEAAEDAFKTTSHKLVATTVAEVAIN
jgi:hypothetical protein